MPSGTKMATVKTLQLVSAAGIKCFQTRFATDFISRTLPSINFIPVRHGRFKSSPLVSDDPTKYTKFEVSRSPEEWKHVQNLLPKPTIPEPQPKTEYPSGWRPQDPPRTPYYVNRTVNHMLPVYMLRTGIRGQRVLTRVRRVQGDVFALERDIRRVLERVYPDAVIKTQVNEVAGQLTVRGDYATACREWLSAQGW